MAQEENLLILKMLQDGTINAEQAAELLQALDSSDSRGITPAPGVVVGGQPTPTVPPLAGSVPLPPNVDHEAEGDAFARARAKIAAARERVAGFQAKLSAAEERIEAAKDSPHRWEQVAEALKDVPGARAVADALRGIDPSRIASGARRQARRVARQVRSSLGDLNLDLSRSFGDSMQGEPTLSAPREATTTVSSGGILRIKNTLGSIEAQGADVPEVRVAGVLKVWAADEAAAREAAEGVTLVVEPGADGATISVRHPDRMRRTVLDLKVFVPQSGARLSLISLAGDVTARNLAGGSAVVLATQTGDARASELVGDVAVETASGEIVVEGVVGNVGASSASGDIKAIRVSGQNFRASTQSGDIMISESAVASASIETVSGDARVKALTGRSLRVRAVSGDAVAEDCLFSDEVHMDTVSGYLSATPKSPLSSGSMTLVTVSGDANLRLPAEANAVLELNTKSGDADARFLGAGAVEKTLRGSGMVRLTEGIGVGSGAKISLSTMSGDLRVTQDSPVIEIS